MANRTSCTDSRTLRLSKQTHQINFRSLSLSGRHKMSRLSMISRQGAQSYNGSRNIYIQRDEFPLLDFKELSICLQGCDFIANEDLVSKPSSQYIRTLFEQLLDTFMGFSPEYCATTTKTLLQQGASSGIDEAGENGSARDEQDLTNDDTSDSLYTLVLFRAANAMLQTCGVHDFTLMDLSRPEPQRVRRILSAVINYARFREEHLRECEPLVRICEKNVEEMRAAEDENSTLKNKIEAMKERLEDESEARNADPGTHRKSSFSQLNNYNSRLEQELKKLQKSQLLLTQEHTQYKEKKLRLCEKLEDHEYLISESMKDIEKLTMYSSADLSLLKRVIEDLKGNLQQAEETLRQCELSYRNRTKTVDSMQLVEDELRKHLKIAQEIMNELKKLDDARENMAKQNDELENKRHMSEELSVHLDRVKRLLQLSEERIAKLRQQALEKEATAQNKLKSLENEYTELVAERHVKEEQLDKMKAQISEIEGLTNAMRSEFDTEYHHTQSAVAKLNTHIRMYLSDIDNEL